MDAQCSIQNKHEIDNTVNKIWNTDEESYAKKRTRTGRVVLLFYVSAPELFPSEYKWEPVMLYDPKNIGCSTQRMAAAVMLH